MVILHSGRGNSRKVRRLVAILDQEFGEDSNLPCGMLTWRSNDICACRGWWMTRHDRHERPGGHIFMGEAVGQVSDAESCCGSGDQGCAVVGLEAPLRTNCDDL